MENSFLYNQKLIEKSEKKTFQKIKSFQIMEKAAFVCYSYIINNLTSKRILILCGLGNNGGDGILIANKLINKNINVDLYFPLGLPKTKDSKKALKLIKNKSCIKKNFFLKKYDLIVDAIFGIGFNKKLDKKIITLINKINNSKIKVLSIDMPSGVYTDTGQISRTAIKADTTLTFHRFKSGQFLLPGKKYCGKIVILNIGLTNFDKKCFLKLNQPTNIFKPSPNDNKYTRGGCLVIADKNYVGASKLSFLSLTKSTLRSGSGYCSLIVNEKYAKFYKLHVLEEMILTYNNIHDFYNLIEKQKSNTVIYGCGVENNSINKKILTYLLQNKINLVIDATAFSIIQKNKSEFFLLLNKRKNQTIMTPHEGEFKRIFKKTNNKVNDCLQASKESNSIIVYKGNDTVIGNPDGQCFINNDSSPYLATAGSGDVLAGIIGGLFSQGFDGLMAARLGCYIHSKCGINLGPGLIASDLINKIPETINNLINSK